MTLMSFAISNGSNIPSPANIETLVTHPPTTLPDQQAAFLGGVETILASGASRRDGRIDHVWTWDMMSRTDFNTLMTFLFGGRLTNSAAVSIITLDEEGNYTAFNARVHKPHPGTEYSASPGDWIRDLRLRFTGLVTYGSFSSDFSLDFEV